jgi:TetR/AcrR family transcriptional regulator
MQQEMLRLHRGEQSEWPILVKRVFAPTMAMFESSIRNGIATGELIDAEWLQMVLAAVGGNVMYFMSSPVWRLILPYDPLAPEAVKTRRTLMVEFLGKAIFKDRERGAELAAKVLADSPMPDFVEFGKLR